MIRHIVAVRFKDDITEDNKAEFYAALTALSGHLTGMKEFRSFVNVSPEEQVVHGMCDLFWVDFTDAEARDAYLADAEHQLIGGQLAAAAVGGAAGIQVLDVEL